MRPFAAILFFLLVAAPAMLSAQTPTFRGRTVTQWSDDLSHPNSVVRVEAAKMLGRIGQQGTHAIDPLIAAMRDRNLDVRMYAATALGRIKQQPEKCLPALTKLLEDRNEHVRFAAEWSLARIANEVVTAEHTAPDSAALDQLLAAAETSLANVVRDTRHLQQIADARKALKPTEAPNNAANSVTPVVEPVVKPGVEPVVKPIVEPAAKPVVEQETPPQPQSTARFRSPLIDGLADLHAVDKVKQLKAMETLSTLGRAAELLDAWKNTDDDGFLRWHLASALIKIGEPAVPELVQTLQNQDDSNAMEAAFILQRMGLPAIGSLPSLLALIEDKKNTSEELRVAAISTIESFGPDAGDAVATLTQLLDHDEPDSTIIASVRTLAAIGSAANAAIPALLDLVGNEDLDLALRMTAAEALPLIDSTSTEVLDTLIALLRQYDDPYFVGRLADSLGQFGAAAEPAVPRLVELLDETTDFEREWIIRALGNIGPSARPATPRLVACLLDVEEFDTVQAAAARAIGKLGPDAVLVLAKQLEHANPYVRQTIARGLVEIGALAEPAVARLELRLVDQDEDLQVRSLVAVALGQIGSSAQAALPTLTSIMGDVEQAVYLRAMAAVAIGQIDPRESPRLIAALKDDNAEIRVAAAYSLQRLATPHPNALATLVRSLEDSETRGMSMQALSEFKDDSQPLLVDVMQDPSQDEQTRIACLSLISENGVAAAPQLIKAMNDEMLAESAYWSLRDLGNDSIPFLIAAAEDEEKYTSDTRALIRELVDELYDGIGGGGAGDDSWAGGHALMDGLHGGHRAAGMEMAAPEMVEWIEPPSNDEPPAMAAPEVIMPPRPEPPPELAADRTSEFDSQPTTAQTALPIAPKTGFKTVKVFYGTNRNPGHADAGNSIRIPWYVWMVVVFAVAAMLLFVIKQFRRGERGRGLVGIAGIVLLCLAVEAAVRRIEHLEQSLDKSGQTYGAEYTNQVKLGFCEVTIPDIHQEGQLERPTVIQWQFVEDPEKHIIVRRVQQLDPETYFADLQSELGQRGNSILVFVHGYNVSFESAARRTAQMSHDLKFAGAPIFYSWPSQANWRKYRVDEKNVELSINQLKSFLLDITERSGADTINLIAHSMGNRALTSALKEIEVSTTQQDKLFNQVILAAPDIDADVFRVRIAPAIVTKARQITLYASSKDLALVASREFNSGDPRAGDAGADLVLVPGIDTIDVSAGESSLLGHSYYGDSASVLQDIEFLLRDHPASERRYLEPYPQREPTHWLFQPASMARRPDATEDRR